MKESDLMRIFVEVRSACMIGGFEFFPASCKLDLFKATNSKCDERFYGKFDFIVLYHKPLTLYKNWKAVLLECCNLADKNRALFCIKHVNTKLGSKNDIIELLTKCFEEVEVEHDFMDHKTGFNTLFVSVKTPKLDIILQSRQFCYAKYGELPLWYFILKFVTGWLKINLVKK